ncbi:hypothetical protein [Klebsiella pneumoniae]|uniref:hypothetical protein n=1 Tax=Klebsiella pneumoniae TaxID=573 RepID=UPI0022B67127|nr:hypothetical protein [Klebsiella pneumoniae]
MQVADVCHFSGPLVAAPALLIQFRVHRLVSGRKMTIKQQERQQPRQKDAGDKPSGTPVIPNRLAGCSR